MGDGASTYQPLQPPSSQPHAGGPNASNLPHTLSPFAKPFLPGGAQGLTKELRWMNSPASEAESATPPRRSYRDAVKEIAVSPEPEPATTPSRRVQATEPKTEAR